MKRTFRAAVLVALAGILVAACGSGDVAVDMPAEGAVGDAAAPSTESLKAESMQAESTQTGQQVIQTANVTLEVDDVDRSVTSITSEAGGIGGFVQSRSINRYDDDATASMTIRIPAADLDDFLEMLSTEGAVLSTTVDSQDVTLEVIDLQARILTLEASIDRLRQLQRQATSVADLVAVESELANRQSELESLTARRDYLKNQVDLSTVYLWIDQKDTGAGLTPDFLGGLERGWAALLTLGAGLITGLGFILPTAIVGLIIAAVVIVIVRLFRGRTKREEQP